MLPETIASGQIELYRCLEFPAKWDLDTVILEGLAGAEPTLLQQDDTWWLFLDVDGDLHLFYSGSPRGPWIAHEANPVKSDARNTRPAGRIFRWGEDYIRPTQDCSIRYGREVVFNKIIRLNRESFDETEIARLPTGWDDAIGCHTFNRADGLTVVDRLVTRRRW
jgi:hypothetical protein